MLLALAQYAPSPDSNVSLAKIVELMNAAARGGAKMIIFPELCLSPFFPQFAGQDASRYAVTIEDEPIRQMQATCLELGLAASPNVYLQQEHFRFDASLILDFDGNIQGISKMVHIAQLPGFYEQDYYAPSDSGFEVYDTPLGRAGVVVCFDRHYPESIRTCTLRGAQLIVIPTANTMDEPRDLYECEVRAAAMQNGVYIAMCNRVGREGNTVFCGESIAIDPHGQVTAKAGDSEELLFVAIDPAEVERARRKRPYLAIRRPETYER